MCDLQLSQQYLDHNLGIVRVSRRVRCVRFMGKNF